jgi:hypothetical protein
MVDILPTLVGLVAAQGAAQGKAQVHWTFTSKTTNQIVVFTECFQMRRIVYEHRELYQFLRTVHMDFACWDLRQGHCSREKAVRDRKERWWEREGGGGWLEKGGNPLPALFLAAENPLN